MLSVQAYLNLIIQGVVTIFIQNRVGSKYRES